MGKKKRKSSMFGDLNNAALGIGGLTMSTAVGASIAAHAPAGTPSMTGSFATIADFAPIGALGIGAGSALKMVKKMNKKKK